MISMLINITFTKSYRIPDIGPKYKEWYLDKSEREAKFELFKLDQFLISL